MDFKKNQKGFSLIEMLVVVAIISILAGVSLRIVGYLRVANAEKTVQTIEKACTKLQATSMSKASKPFLYIYMNDGEYYYVFSATDCNSYDASVMKKDGDPIGKGIKITREASGTMNEVTGAVFIKIAYKRDGTFDTAKTNCDAIKIEAGNSTERLKLVKETGKVINKLTD